jgi:hypothetical protein
MQGMGKVTTVEVRGEHVVVERSGMSVALTFTEVCAAAHALREHALRLMPVAVEPVLRASERAEDREALAAYHVGVLGSDG